MDKGNIALPQQGNYQAYSLWFFTKDMVLDIIQILGTSNIFNRNGSMLQGVKVATNIYWYNDRGIIVFVVEQDGNHFIYNNVKEKGSLLCV